MSRHIMREKLFSIYRLNAHPKPIMGILYVTTHIPQFAAALLRIL
jgi:hypothetical protein